jgi:hypothetical protein
MNARSECYTVILSDCGLSPHPLERVSSQVKTRSTTGECPANGLLN